jgi:hypothetical protein
MSSSVGRNSLIMATGTAASRLTGQIRTILLAAAIGTTGLAANAYQAGSMIPQVVFTLVSGGIFNAVLVPQIVRTLQQKDAEDRLNKLITFAVVLLLAVTLLMTAGTPLLTRLYVGGGSDMLALTNAFTLWCMPQIFFYGLYTVVGQILAAKDHFGTYAWSSVGANVISSVGFVAFIALFGRADRQPLGLLDHRQDRTDSRHVDAGRRLPGTGAVPAAAQGRHPIPPELGAQGNRAARDGACRRMERGHRGRRAARHDHQHQCHHQRARPGRTAAGAEPVRCRRQRQLPKRLHDLHTAVFAYRRFGGHGHVPAHLTRRRRVRHRVGPREPEPVAAQCRADDVLFHRGVPRDAHADHAGAAAFHKRARGGADGRAR